MPDDIAKIAAEAILEEFRDRKLLEYLFDPEPWTRRSYGYLEAPIDVHTQQEIAEAIVRIVRTYLENSK